MRLDVLAYIVVTLASIKYATPWLADLKTAFVTEGGKVKYRHLLSALFITIAYVVLNNAINFAMPWLGNLTSIHIRNIIWAIVFWTFVNSVFDGFALAIAVKAVSKHMRVSSTSEAIKKASLVSIILAVVTTLAQNALALEIMGLN